MKYNQRRFFIIRWGGPGFWIPFRQGLPQDGVFSYVAFLWTCSWIKRESPPESERAFLESGRAHFSLRVGWTRGFLQTGLGVSGRVLARSRIHHRFLANSSTPRLCWGAPLQGGALVESVSTAYASRTYPRSGRIRSCTVNPVLEISASVLGGVLFAIWAVNIVCRPEATGSFVGIESSYCRMHAQFENVYPEVLICPHGRENWLPRRLQRPRGIARTSHFRGTCLREVCRGSSDDDIRGPMTLPHAICEASWRPMALPHAICEGSRPQDVPPGTSRASA